MQKITYDEFLPALLGPVRPGADGLQPYRGYRADVNPGIATEFSTVAFRVGHSMLGDDIEFLAGDGTPVRDPLSLRDAFFNPAPLSEVGIDPILKYLGSVRGQEIDPHIPAGRVCVRQPRGVHGDRRTAAHTSRDQLKACG